MIFWSSKTEIVGYYDEFAPEDCRICGLHTAPLYKVEQSYFALYGLPIFPTARTAYKTCSGCASQLKVKKNDPNNAKLSEVLPFKIKFKYVWGWLVFIAIGLGIAYLLNSVK